MPIRTHSMRQIKPYSKIVTKIHVLPDLGEGGIGILPYLFPIYSDYPQKKNACWPTRGSQQGLEPESQGTPMVMPLKYRCQTASQ